MGVKGTAENWPASYLRGNIWRPDDLSTTLFSLIAMSLKVLRPALLSRTIGCKDNIWKKECPDLSSFTMENFEIRSATTLLPAGQFYFSLLFLPFYQWGYLPHVYSFVSSPSVLQPTSLVKCRGNWGVLSMGFVTQLTSIHITREKQTQAHNTGGDFAWVVLVTGRLRHTPIGSWRVQGCGLG